MAGTPLLLVALPLLLLLLQGFSCSQEPAAKGCLKWSINDPGTCCEACHPGHRLVKKCGKPADLCRPCENGTFTLTTKPRCFRCRECVGALVQLKACTATANTVCGCKKGLTCADERCSYCVDECVEGQEPTTNGSCRPCPDGTFSDKIQQKCKPWSTKCPNPNQVIIASGDAFTDIRCGDVLVTKTIKPESADEAKQAWLLVLPMIVGIVLTMIIAVIITAIVKMKKKPKKLKIRPPSDDPQTLRSFAIECSFHEAEQEQGSSTESLDSKDSSDQLIGA